MATCITLLLSPKESYGQCTPNTGTISGLVFNDKNYDGVFNIDDLGKSSILVQAYNNKGELVGSQTTTSDGNYSINGLQDGQMIRLLFTHTSNLSSSRMGLDNGTSVQYIKAPACNVRYAVVEQNERCNLETDVLTTCFVQGSVATNVNEPTIVGVKYGFISNSTPRKLASHSETGSIWGLAWKSSTKEIFSASFVKQYCGLKNGHDAIFNTKFNGVSYTTNTFAKLSDLGQTVGTLTENNISNCAYGAQVGKIGLGALVISPDEKYLYVVNLFNNTLVRILVSNPTIGNTQSYQIPGSGIHAFALKYHNEKIYVGITKPGDEARVLEFDPISATFIDTGLEIDAGADWNDLPVLNAPPSHWLTDIDFSDKGDMIIALSDRIGHIYCNELTNRLDEQKGDLLIAFKTDSGWNLEDRNTPDLEFFSDDFWAPNPNYHAEITIGGIYTMPGTNSVVATVFDPELNSYSGGFHRYNTATGKKEGSIELYTRETQINFGKATGFGEVIGACGLPGIEIGNLVWLDENDNGIQDADEPHLSDVILHLLNEDCEEIGTTTTDANGNYVFNNNNVIQGLQANQIYYLALDSKYLDSETNSILLQGNYYSFAKFVGESSLINSDFDFKKKACVAGIIEVTTNEISHIFDIGLAPASDCNLKISKSVLNTNDIKINDTIFFQIVVHNRGTSTLSSYEVTDELPSGYIFPQSTNIGWQQTNQNIVITKNVRLLPGDRDTSWLKLVFDKANRNIQFTNSAAITAAKDGIGNPMSDIQSCFVIAEDGISNDLPQICDLALYHKVAEEKVYVADSEVRFNTTVCNQGTLTSPSFDIVNYLTSDLDFDPSSNLGWTLSSSQDMITFKETKALEPNTCREYQIIFTIEENTEPSSIINYAEISGMACTGTAANFDFDSKPDFDVKNDAGGQANTVTDNMIDDHGVIDEDDQDPATLNVDVIDLSIKKHATARRVVIGTEIDFFLDIKNEGQIAISKVRLADYLPATLTLIDPTWTIVGNRAEKTIEIPGNLQPGATYRATIKCRVNELAIHPFVIRNAVEIIEVYDHLRRDVSELDTDSTPDNFKVSELKELQKSGQEDDVSYIDISLICLPEITACGTRCVAATTPNNGMFETIIKFAGIAGDDWRIYESDGLFDTLSTPGMPLTLPNPYFLLIEPHSVDYDYYVIKALHLDNKGFFVRVINKFGETEQFSINPGTCQFSKVSLSGPASVCLGSTRSVYKASFQSNSPFTYTWVVDDNGTPEASDTLSITGPTLDTLWTTSGMKTIRVFSSTLCSAPAELAVNIGTSPTGSMSCIGNFNVSLDNDCSIFITPSMLAAGTLGNNAAYSVMLTDIHGKIIPNATITSAHAGTKVMAKLVETCSSNSCWSIITVEDKTPPISICSNITLPCYHVDTYGGPFERDNCDGPVKNVIVSEKITPICSGNILKYLDRVYQATDKAGNKSALCAMRITVLRPDLSDGAGLLLFPANKMMANALTCGDFKKDSNGRPHPSVTGVPTLAGIPLYPSIDEICNLISWYVDKEIRIGCTIKIIRTWHVYEQCASDYQYETHDQTIEISDNKPPNIKPFANVTITTSGHNCEGEYLVPMPEVFDSCGSPITIDVTYPGGFIKDMKVATKIKLLASNTPHPIIIKATDACFNASQISFSVSVLDKTPPTVICKGQTVAGLNSQGEAYLYPTNINDGSYDECGIDSMKIARMVDGVSIPDSLFKKYIEFNCNDAGKSIMVSLRVWDKSGNSNSCMVSVEIQDKFIPQIQCPPNTTIDCSEVFTGMDLTKYGAALAIDACNPMVEALTPIFKLSQCRVGVIERPFRAFDGTNQAFCTQIITVESNVVNRFDPIRDVTLPLLEYVVSDKCSPDDLKPENLPEAYRGPTIRQTACSMAASSYKDEVYTIVSGACYKIIRTWIIIDWCEMDRLKDKYVPYHFVQIIKVNNTVPPYFVGVLAERDTFFTQKGNCKDTQVNLSATAKDLCTPDSELRYQYKIDWNNNGNFDITNFGKGNVASINSIFPVGLHKVQWSFEDACGNIVTKNQLIYVVNNDKPVVVSLEKVSVSVLPWDIDGDGIPDIEKVCIDASSLNASSYSLCCTEPLRYSFSSNVDSTKMCFDCTHVGRDNKIQLWATDCNGNSDFVTVKVDVQDNNDVDACKSDCVQNPIIASISGPTVTCRGNAITLTASGGANYEWSNGFTTQSIVVNPNNTTTYTVIVSGQFNCADTASITVTVLDSPLVSIEGANICTGQSTTLTASGNGTYLWNTGATTASIIVNITNTTTYTVTVTAANGCSASTTRIVTVAPPPNVNITGDTIVCINQSTKLTATGGGTYLWSTGATTSMVEVTPTVITTYSVTVTDINGCTATRSQTITVNGLTINPAISGNIRICKGDSTILTASGGNMYLWNNNATTAAITVKPMDTTQYTVTVTDLNGCTGIARATVLVQPLPTIIISGNNIFCPLDTVTLTASGATTYLWNTGATAASIKVTQSGSMTFSVTGTDSNGCRDTASIQLRPAPPINIVIMGDTLICPGDSTIWTASGGVSYIWNTNQDTASILIKPTTSTTFNVKVTDVNGCVDSLSRTINLRTPPNVSISGNLMICVGDSTILTASGGVTYIWNTGATTASIKVIPATSTMYTVTVTDIHGCTSSRSTTVVVDPGTLVCTTRNLTVYLNANGSASINPVDISTGAVGACANISASVTPAQFFCNDVGIPQVVTLTVTNINTNASLSCTAQITVVDSLAPMMTCPQNVTIDCTTFDPNAPLTTFGTATAVDNCLVGLTIIEAPAIRNLNSCNAGQIVRTFIATDRGGRSSQCVQIITIGSSGGLTLPDIVFPPNTSTSSCVGIDTSITGNVRINKSLDVCSRVSISFSDSPTPQVPLCAQTITRTWLVIDTCQLLPGTQNGRFTFNQTITVTPQLPGISGPAQISLQANGSTCQAELSGIFHSASGCNLTLSNSANSGPSFDIQGNYPVGNTTVTLTATDICGAMSTFNVLIMVEDTSSLQITCIKAFPEITDQLIVNEPVSSFYVINTFCSDSRQVLASFSGGNTQETTMEFQCGEVGQRLSFKVYFYFQGESSHFFSCDAIAGPLDPNNFCGSGRPAVSGSVITDNGQPVRNVEVTLDGSNGNPVSTNNVGNYEFPDMPSGGTYNVIPNKNSDLLEGVSTLDLINIQRHVLKTELLTSPYQNIAADVNKDGKITASDITMLRKVILGIQDHFGDNKSWRMVDKMYSFPDPNDPFATPFPESYYINSLTNDMKIDWVGIKVGDVNNSYTANLNDNTTEVRNKSIEFVMKSTKQTSNDNTLEFVTSEAHSLSGFQLSINIGDAKNIRLQSDILDIDPQHYHIKDGVLRISWHNQHGINISKGTKLFEIISKDANILDNVFIVNELRSELYTPLGETRSIFIKYEADENQNFKLFGNTPNPWNQQTDIRFYLPEDGQVVLKVRDITGKMVYTTSEYLSKGSQNILLDNTKLNTSGILIYEVIFKDEVKTLKMLHIR